MFIRFMEYMNMKSGNVMSVLTRARKNGRMLWTNECITLARERNNSKLKQQKKRKKKPFIQEKIHSFAHKTNHLKRCRIQNYARGNMCAAWSVCVCDSFHALTDAFHTHSSSKQRETAFSAVCPLFALYYLRLEIYTFSPPLFWNFTLSLFFLFDF